MDLNFSSCSRGTERFSIFNSAENKLRSASRWSMASAAMTPREFETAASLFRLPDDRLTALLRSKGRLRSKMPNTQAEIFYCSISPLRPQDSKNLPVLHSPL